MNLDVVLDTLKIRAQTPLQVAIQAASLQADKTLRDITELEAHFKAIQGYIQRHSKSPPLPTDRALSQLVKGCQMAIHNAVLLANENAKLRAVNIKQKGKRQVRSSHIARGRTLTIAEGQERLREPEVQVNTHVYA
jgi:hypothetical protein